MTPLSSLVIEDDEVVCERLSNLAVNDQVFPKYEKIRSRYRIGVAKHQEEIEPHYPSFVVFNCELTSIQSDVLNGNTILLFEI